MTNLPAPTLSELQSAVCRSLLRRTEAAAGELVVADGLDGSQRLDIYRNTMTMALVRALRLSYPAIHCLVGADFFEGAARMFIDRSPPRSAWLDEYGADFPEFLARFPQAASIGYLADVARLERLINGVLHAPDAKPLQPARLAQLNEAELGRLRLAAHPAIRLCRSEYPVDSIWRAVLERDESAMAAIDLADGPVWLLICRSENSVDVDRLSEGQWRLTSSIFSGMPLQQALDETPCNDAYDLLAAHLARGCFADAGL
ncbi:DNA-binding domain-containing protein [Noviherbaspirillum sedimenti]|uniref:DUF2063 domain-containing protein n=1 Tax=Noviherbaspirillum sedimenti TaxID=2320865 RepID=A0A3A3FXR6_9BURK|nr:DNA-binding domain-containing protein [Noviherbaspirillum sedimenti]RJG00504.1 DUF2063 domain-containing protein [Noviherbaspirillum sedimenti]